MNVINATILKNNLIETLNDVAKKRDYLLVATKGKVTSALVDIDLFEDLISLADKNYKNTIKKARKEYERGENFTHEQVFDGK